MFITLKSNIKIILNKYKSIKIWLHMLFIQYAILFIHLLFIYIITVGDYSHSLNIYTQFSKYLTTLHIPNPSYCHRGQIFFAFHYLLRKRKKKFRGLQYLKMDRSCFGVCKLKPMFKALI